MLFSQIIGHTALISRLIGTVNEGRVPHAQLYYGAEGSGSLALALAYARYLLCANRQEQDACGVCPSCQKVQKLIHPDLHFIYPVATTPSVKEKPRSADFIDLWRQYVIAKQAYGDLPGWFEYIGIEKKQGIINVHDCNEIVRTLGYTSYEGAYKIMVIWMAEKLYHAAAPKLLKILEEPPDKTVFLLISANTDHVMATILSRTQMIRVPRIDDNDLLHQLRKDPTLDEAVIRKAVLLANGSYPAALQHLEQKEDEETLFHEFRNWMLLCYQYKIPELIKFAEEAGKYPREHLKRFFQYGTQVFRYGFHLSILDNPDIRMDGKELEFVRNFSKYIHTGNTETLYRLLNEGIFHIERNANPQILLIDISLSIHKALKT